MHSVAIGKNILGTRKNLRYDGDAFFWVDQPEIKDICVGCGGLRDLGELYEIFHGEFPNFIPKNYRRAFEYINEDGDNHYKMLAISAKKNHRENVRNVFNNLQKFPNEEYVKHFYKGQKFLNMLKPARIDLETFSEIKEHLPSSKSFIVREGYLMTPRYSRCGTTTGRLTIKRGPQILTMKKEYRKMLIDAKQVDFSSMEPRLLLATQGKFPEGDLYEWIANEAGLEGSRAKNKVSILASLYGSRNSIKTVDEVFSLKKKFEELNASVIDGYIRNFYGRPVKVEGQKDHKLLSLWLQSSAVDAALIGFHNMFKDSDLVPLWVIHDACIFAGNTNFPTYLDIGKGIELPVTISEV